MEAFRCEQCSTYQDGWAEITCPGCGGDICDDCAEESEYCDSCHEDVEEEE